MLLLAANQAVLPHAGGAIDSLPQICSFTSWGGSLGRHKNYIAGEFGKTAVC